MTINELQNALKVYIGSIQASSLYIGNFLIWRKQIAKLPQGYTELEYISSDGTQHIDLGCKIFDTTDLVTIWTKFNFKGNVGTAAGVLINAVKQSNPWPGWTICLNNGASNLELYRGYINNQGTFPTTPKNTIYETPASGLVIGNAQSGYTHDITTTLFCNKETNGAYNRYAIADLYYLKIQKGNNIIVDLVPVKNPNNVVGLYDYVTKTFYSAPNGRNAFVAGPAVLQNYITDGLIFHLDGINKGTGSDWTDLIGNIQFSQTGTGCSSTSNSWSFPGNSEDYLVSADDAWASIGGSDDFTIEVCYNNTRGSAKTFLFGFGGGVFSKYPVFYHDGTNITWIQGGYTYNASSMTGNSKNTVSLNNDNGLVNGQQIQKTSSTDYWDQNHSNIRIGSAYSGGAAGFPTNGDIYSIRIYNRKLSQSEQLQNQKIDNQRFNLGLSI